MELNLPKYLSDLNAAKHQSLLDWPNPEANVYVLTIGVLIVRVWLNKRWDRWDWTLSHERRGLLNNGYSETQTLAQLEALSYGEHFVKREMRGLVS